jgi:hypothetical protein
MRRNLTLLLATIFCAACSNRQDAVISKESPGVNDATSTSQEKTELLAVGTPILPTDLRPASTSPQPWSYPAFVALAGSTSFSGLAPWGNVWNRGAGALLGDVDGDGKADYTWVPFAVLPVVRSVQLSTGHSFANSQPWLTLPDNTKFALMLADVDGDKRADVIFHASGGEIFVAKSNGHAFEAPLPWGQCNGLIAVGDLNGDGKGDLVCYNQTDTSVTVALSNGTMFVNPVKWLDHTISSTGQAIVQVADMDGDGKGDLVLAPTGGPGVYVAYSSGTGFSPLWPWKFPEPVSGSGFALGDVNGDRRADIIIVTSTAVHIGINSGSDFVSTPQWNVSLPPKSYGVALGDFNGDGKLDLQICTASN